MILISRKTGLNVYPRHISVCLERSALGYKWDFGTQSGSNPYLCNCDIRKLSEIVRNANADGCSLDTLEVIDEATRIKGERLTYGLKFLKEINSLDLAQKIADQTLYSPTRSWINGVLDDLDSHIRSPRLIDEKRLVACSYQVLDGFFQAFGPVLQRINPLLMFNADETMLQTNVKKSYCAQ